MGEEFYFAIFVFLCGIVIFWLGIFYTTKNRFLYGKAFETIKDILPLPSIVNYWIIKLLFIIGGTIIIIAGIYGVINPF